MTCNASAAAFSLPKQCPLQNFHPDFVNVYSILNIPYSFLFVNSFLYVWIYFIYLYT